LAPIPAHIKALDDLGLDPEVRRKIMVGNAERLMKMRFN
jgi:predicted TIM-barrel fold metal-dependent hydrolase